MPAFFSRLFKRLTPTPNLLDSIAAYLDSLRELPSGLSAAELQTHVETRLEEILHPLGFEVRLWLVDRAWKALVSNKDLASAHVPRRHMPMSACPALLRREPYLYEASSRNPCPSETFRLAQHICLPLSDERESFGVLFIGTSDAKTWTQEWRTFFNALAHTLTLAFQRRVAVERLQEKIADLNFSFEVGASALSAFGESTQSIEETTLKALETFRTVLQVNRVSFMHWDPIAKRLKTRWVQGAPHPTPSPLELESGQGMAGWALESGEPYWAEYAMGDLHFVPGSNSITSLLCVPLFLPNHEPLGVINAATSLVPRRFGGREIEFATHFGRLAALALLNARLHHESRLNIGELKEIDRVKSHFLSLVSHDLRGPLTGIRGFSEVLKEQTLGPLNATQMDLLEQMESQVELQERMVDDLLDFARMEKGKLSIHTRECDLPAVLKEETDKFRRMSRDRDVKLETIFKADARLNGFVIDPGRIRQVIWNLIHNAIKYTPEGGRVEVRVQATDAGAVIEIADTGVGLSEETQAKIFDAFFQVSPGGSKGASGLGLGLAICREIVQSHGGTIRVASKGLGFGASFTLELPYRDKIAAVQTPG